MNYDEYGFPIFDDEYDESIAVINVDVIKKCSVEKIDIEIDVKNEDKPSNLLFDL
jgi:hypothetical protein